MKIADPVLLSVFMRHNEKRLISHATITGLSGTQFSILIVLESLIPKDQKKYNNTKMKSIHIITSPTFLNCICNTSCICAVT